MLVTIDPSSSEPLFAQVAAAIRADIAAGTLRAGDRLPPARDVADGLGVNIHTVLRAYGILREDGIVDVRRGRGAVVTDLATTLAELHHDVVELLTKARIAGVSGDVIAAIVKECSRG